MDSIKQNKTLKHRSILKPSSRRHATSKILIDRVERSVKKRINSLRPAMNKSLKSKSSTFKKSFKNRYNRYINAYTRNEIRKKLGKDTRKSVKFSNNYGTKI